MAAEGGEFGLHHVSVIPLSLTPDDDCPVYDGTPFDLLSGENVEYVGRPDGEFIIIISNYRFFAAQKNGFYNVST